METGRIDGQGSGAPLQSGVPVQLPLQIDPYLAAFTPLICIFCHQSYKAVAEYKAHLGICPKHPAVIENAKLIDYAAQLLDEVRGISVIYGHFPGGDPRHFEPDRDCNSPEEILEWENLCNEWDKGNEVEIGPACHTEVDPSGSVSFTVTGSVLGVGSYWSCPNYPEDPTIAKRVLARLQERDNAQ